MTEDQHTSPTQNDMNAGYEKSDVNVKRILTIVVSIALFLVVAFIVLNSFFIKSRESLMYEQVLKPQSEKLQALHEREAEALHSYGVVDSANNVYRIPIERAMQLEAEDAFQQRVNSSGN